jgi:hemerythrin-like metal-binding protein
MAAINWTDDLSVRISSIDEQHKKLITLINDFYENIRANSSKERIHEMIQALKEYTVYHFTTEEKLMTLHAFPGYAKHKEEHDRFVQKVLDFEERYKSGKLILTIEITNFIKDWVAKHICDTDKKYSDFLIKKGVK